MKIQKFKLVKFNTNDIIGDSIWNKIYYGVLEPIEIRTLGQIGNNVLINIETKMVYENSKF